MTVENGPPPIVGPKGGSVINIINVVKSMHAMIAHIMSESIHEISIEQIKRHIKLFLTYFDIMDGGINGNEKKLVGYHVITLSAY